MVLWCAFIGVSAALRAIAMLRLARRFVREARKATSLRSYDVREELVLWDFRRPETLREWNCISDRDMGGHSAAYLEPNGRGSSLRLRSVIDVRVFFRNGSKVSRPT